MDDHIIRLLSIERSKSRDWLKLQDKCHVLLANVISTTTA
jgi:hypothetical protein